MLQGLKIKTASIAQLLIAAATAIDEMCD